MLIVSKYQIVSGKNKRIINMLSAEIAKWVLTTIFQQMTFWNSFLFFLKKLD